MTNFNVTHACNATFNQMVVHVESINAHDFELTESMINVIGRDDAIRFILGKVSIDRHHEIEAILVNAFAHHDVLTVYARIDELLLRAKPYVHKTVI